VETRSSPHFPAWWVEYPALFMIVAMPVIFRGIPLNPDTGSFGLKMLVPRFLVLTCVGSLPAKRQWHDAIAP
jgi:hypothetical protein